MGDSVKEIQKLLKTAKGLESKGELLASKNKYLDAATMALRISKSIPSQSKKFAKIAEQLVNEARRIDILLDLDVASDLPHVGSEITNHDEPRNKERKAESIDSDKYIDRTNEVKSIGSDESADSDSLSIKELLDGFNLTAKQESLTVPLGNAQDTAQLVSWMPGQEMNGFLMITGGSGSGKTEGIRSLVTELTQYGYPCTILDLHGDIDVDIPTISFDYTGTYGINPMAITNTSELEGGPIPKINELMDRFDEAVETPFSATQKNMLKNVLKNTYGKFGILQADPASWEKNQPNFSDLEQSLRDKLKVATGTESATINAILSRLSPLLEHPAFHSSNVVEYESLLQFPFRIVLKPLRSIGLQFLACDTIMRQLFTYLKSNGHVETNSDSSKFRMFLVVDEAKILMGYRGKTNDPQNILNILATEARKFGLGMILASQLSKHFGNEVKANFASKLILKPMNTDQAKDNAKEINISSKVLELLKLPGEGYYKSSSINDPVNMRLFPFSLRPFKIDNSNT